MAARGHAGAASLVGVLHQGSADFASSFLVVAAVVLICPATLLALRRPLERFGGANDKRA